MSGHLIIMTMKCMTDGRTGLLIEKVSTGGQSEDHSSSLA